MVKRERGTLIPTLSLTHSLTLLLCHKHLMSEEVGKCMRKKVSERVSSWMNEGVKKERNK